ncbi:hypothetical protein DFA_07210 [Cavenderia fasciculata]|uniref:Uncharacterized protein n=1 Tax=Cavenderia fasciculata TaxID=261658 RepID=F4PVS9_CACFS|nr:uncharacterized protein DFA_07210 [Cavenderia fasciculata]EGG20093.1 hypothetical protein DFA_07210 [Cavenderia fasciculata]|eukprot:XP_004367076.1 hypothetical protein DFA_07210 [Cavenderia fasciculata]
METSPIASSTSLTTTTLATTTTTPPAVTSATITNGTNHQTDINHVSSEMDGVGGGFMIGDSGLNNQINGLATMIAPIPDNSYFLEASPAKLLLPGSAIKSFNAPFPDSPSLLNSGRKRNSISKSPDIGVSHDHFFDMPLSFASPPPSIIKQNHHHNHGLGDIDFSGSPYLSSTGLFNSPSNLLVHSNPKPIIHHHHHHHHNNNNGTSNNLYSQFENSIDHHDDGDDNGQTNNIINQNNNNNNNNNNTNILMKTTTATNNILNNNNNNNNNTTAIITNNNNNNYYFNFNNLNNNNIHNHLQQYNTVTVLNQTINLESLGRSVNISSSVAGGGVSGPMTPRMASTMASDPTAYNEKANQQVQQTSLYTLLRLWVNETKPSPESLLLNMQGGNGIYLPPPTEPLPIDNEPFVPIKRQTLSHQEFDEMMMKNSDTEINSSNNPDTLLQQHVTFFNTVKKRIIKTKKFTI